MASMTAAHVKPEDRSMSTELAQLGKDLNFSSDADSAALLTALLDHYRKQHVSPMNGVGNSSLQDEKVNSTDVVCVVALDTANAWLSESSSRADALIQYETFMLQLKDWTSEYLRANDERIAPYIPALQVLLRMCMNSTTPAKAVLTGDIFPGLIQIISTADESSLGFDSSCAGLCAAIISVCLLRCPDLLLPSGPSHNIVAATCAFVSRIRERWDADGQLDSDSLYMALALLRLAQRRMSAATATDIPLQLLPEAELNVLAMLDGLLEGEHLHASSMALAVLADAANATPGFRDAIASASSVGKVIDLVSSISLAKAPRSDGVLALPTDAGAALDGAAAGGTIEEQQAEALIASLRFLADATEGSPSNVAAIMDCYPGIIIRNLLRNPSSSVIAAACTLIARLAEDNPEAQRYLRLEEALQLLVSTLASHAVKLHSAVRSGDGAMQGHAEVIMCSSQALCAMLNGSPDSHMDVATSGSGGKVARALAALAPCSRAAAADATGALLEQVMLELTSVLAVLCRNITNRKALCAPENLDALVAALEACHAAYRRGAGSIVNGEAASEATADTAKIALYVLVTLATGDSNVARHLVELESFMPLLFSLLDIGPTCAALDHASALLLLLVRDCKINKGMLVRVGVPSIVRMLQQHADTRVSPTTVQALSGVVTLLAMSKTMLDLVQQTGGLRLVLELLEYAPPAGRGLEHDAVERTCSIHEASCVLITCLCDLSSRARAEIAATPAIVHALVSKVLSVSTAEIDALATAAGGTGQVARAARGTAPGAGAASARPSSEVAELAEGAQQQALVTALGQLMQSSGPDNYVFQAAASAMERVRGSQHASASERGGDGSGSARRGSITALEDEDELGLSERGGRGGGLAAPGPAIPADVKLQLTLAATNTLFRLLHSIPELARAVWDVGGPPLVHRIIALASRLRDSFEEAGTKLLVVFFSHSQIQDAVREAGLIDAMVELIASGDPTAVLIATKALAVVCRNSPANQALAIESGLLHRCIDLLRSELDAYTAKWVILVMNALVFENAAAQGIILEQGAVPLIARWLGAGPEQEVATAAARALAKAAKGNPAVQRAICTAGGIPGFVGMLHGKPGSLAVRAAAEALSDLAKENAGGQDEVREAGAIPRLLELLRGYMDSSSLVVTVVKALSVLAHGNHANMEAIYRLGGVPVLLEMLAPGVGPVSNAAAADLVRVLCSNELCQQQILRNRGLQVLLTTLRTTEYAAAQSATVWAINALVQGQKSMLPQLLHPDTIETFLHCICAENGAAPGTVRLLLVVFLHSGKHEELRSYLLESDAALAALLRMLAKGPAVEPTKWTASLLSTLCWQEGSMKAKMLDLGAPSALVKVLEASADNLNRSRQTADSMRTIVEATISCLQALISLVDESAPELEGGSGASGESEMPGAALRLQAVQADCVTWVCRAGCACMAAISRLHEMQGTSVEVVSHQQKLLKPLLRSLDWLLPLHTPPPPEVEELFEAVDSAADGLKSLKRHADELRAKYCAYVIMM